jgi:hypothetical protein
MVNCNPETVSTDYDTSDRLYFEPVTLEHVLEILRVEQEAGTLHGVIVQFGGQTPLKLADALQDEGIPILGTTPDAIDLAEDRERFQVKRGFQMRDGEKFFAEGRVRDLARNDAYVAAGGEFHRDSVVGASGDDPPSVRAKSRPIDNARVAAGGQSQPPGRRGPVLGFTAAGLGLSALTRLAIHRR